MPGGMPMRARGVLRQIPIRKTQNSKQNTGRKSLSISSSVLLCFLKYVLLENLPGNNLFCHRSSANFASRKRVEIRQLVSLRDSSSTQKAE